MFNVNMSEAMKSLRNLTENYNYSFNISNYPSIQKLTDISVNVNETNKTVDAFFTFINDYWGKLMGEWFYIFLIYFTVGIVYVKMKSIFPTTLALLLLSVAIMGASMAGIASLSMPAMFVLYISLVLGFAGVLYALFVGRSI